MTHYKSNLRDLEFNLFEVFGADRTFGQAPYTDLDVDTARRILGRVSYAQRFPIGRLVPPVGLLGSSVRGLEELSLALRPVPQSPRRQSRTAGRLDRA